MSSDLDSNVYTYGDKKVNVTETRNSLPEVDGKLGTQNDRLDMDRLGKVQVLRVRRLISVVTASLLER